MAGAALSKRDTKLLELAANGASPEEMEAATNIPAAQCYMQVKTVLARRDVWTEIERKQLLLNDLYTLKAQIQTQNLTYIDEKQAGALIKTLKAIGEILERQGALSESEINQITEANARAMIRLISAAFERAKELLRTEYPDVDIREIEAAFNAGLSQEVQEVVTVE